MTHLRKINCLWLVPVFVLLFSTSAVGFTLRSSIKIGKIVPLEGLVVIRRKTVGTTVKPPAMAIYRGDEILTNEKGKARILLTGGNEVYVGPSSTLYLNKHFQDRYKYTYNLNLKGKLRAKVQRVRGRRFRVKTSTALIDVKGTDFIVDSTQSETTQVATFKGLVTLTSVKTKQTVDIPPGRMSVVTKVGEVEKTKKVEIKIVKNLENTGKTGIKNLDKVMEPPPPLDPTIMMEIESEPLPIPEPMPEDKKVEKTLQPVIVAKNEAPPPVVKSEPEPEPESPLIWYYAEEYRKKNRLGFGFGIEAGPFEGSYAFIEYNLTAQTQLHLQFAHNSQTSMASDRTLSDQQMQRELTALTGRYFMENSGAYMGLGLGSAYYEKEYNQGSVLRTLSANSSIAVLELGAQVYGKAFDTTFYTSVGTQFYFNTDLVKDYDETTVGDLDEDFVNQTNESRSLFMLGFGWFF